MSFSFRPAESFTDGKACFVSLTGGTNSGKTFSALRLAKGIAGPSGKIAVLDTEGGRTLHLKNDFQFDANIMDPPFHPARFAEAAAGAEEAGYAVLLIDSFSMEWAGIGGVLRWQEEEIERMAGDDWKKRERVKMASWIKPKGAHKAMVYSLLQRRIPIIFSIRGEETVKPGGPGEKPETVFKSICSKEFPFEVTVSFRLASDRKGYIDLSDPRSWKMEGAHQAIFRDGDRISEDHGRLLAEWARGGTAAPAPGQQAKPAGKFWARSNYLLPVSMTADGAGSDWTKWAAQLRNAIADAPDDQALAKLATDNAVPLGNFGQDRPDEAADLARMLGLQERTAA